jgi:hypothetical protein
MILLRAGAVDTEILTLVRDRSRGSDLISEGSDLRSGAEAYVRADRREREAERELGA